MSIIEERQATPDDQIDWLTAAPVPVAVHQKKPGVRGVVLKGPGGQKTFKGTTRCSVPDDEWREGLKSIDTD